jgi:putative tryptophan/tyrosine transport system substrate-binding protein
MRRREFIAGLGATALPLAARAQQPGRMRRIGALMPLAADDPESLAGVTAFAQGLQELGWTIGRNVRIDYRWGGSNTESLRTSAAELLAFGPDVLLATTGSIARALQQATRTVPIVFTALDPVGSGLVASLARPGGNATGFSGIEYGLSAKWLELLKQIAPRVMRTAVVRDPTAAAGGGQLGAIQAVAPSFGVEVSRRTRGRRD